MRIEKIHVTAMQMNRADEAAMADLQQKESKKYVETIIEEIKKGNISISYDDLIKIIKIILNNYDKMNTESYIDIIGDAVNNLNLKNLTLSDMFRLQKFDINLNILIQQQLLSNITKCAYG